MAEVHEGPDDGIEEVPTDGDGIEEVATAPVPQAEPQLDGDIMAALSSEQLGDLPNQ